MRKILFLVLFAVFVFGDSHSIIDANKYLQWQDTPDIAENIDIWKKSKSYCKALVLEGYDDWRLPTKAELLHLFRSSGLKKRFKYLDDRVFWTVEEDPADDINAITVYSQNGFVSSDDKCNDNYTVCVRSRFE